MDFLEIRRQLDSDPLNCFLIQKYFNALNRVKKPNNNIEEAYKDKDWPSLLWLLVNAPVEVRKVFNVFLGCYSVNVSPIPSILKKIGSIKHPSCSLILVDILKEGNTYRPYEEDLTLAKIYESSVIGALGNIGNSIAVPALENYLGKIVATHLNEKFLKDAVSALSKIKDKKSSQVLMKYINKFNELDEVHKQIVLALGEVGDSNSVSCLIELLEHEDYEIQQAALDSLGKIGDPEAVEEVVKCIDNEDLSEKAKEVLELIMY